MDVIYTFRRKTHAESRSFFSLSSIILDATSLAFSRSSLLSYITVNHLDALQSLLGLDSRLTSWLKMLSTTPQSKLPQHWIARAAELKAELMATRYPVNGRSGPSVEIHSQIESQNSVSSISPSSDAIIRSASTNTLALAPAPQQMASAAHETDVHELQKEMKELEKIIAFGPSNAQLSTTANNGTQPPDAPAATEHVPSTPVKLPINTADCKDNKDETSKTVLQSMHPKEHKSNDANEAVSKPHMDIRASQPSNVNQRDMIGALHNDNKLINTTQPFKKTKNGNIKENWNLADGKMPPKGPQVSKEGNIKEVIQPGSPPSNSPVPKTPASGLPQKTAAHPPASTNAPQIQRHPVPEKPVSKLPAQDTAPPPGPRNYMGNNWELQHYRPSANRAPVDRKIHEPRGSIRLPSPVLPWLSLPPDLSTDYRPRDPDFELEKLASKDRDLEDWLVFTGWHSQEYRADFLERNRRLAHLDRERRQIEQERARLMSADECAPKTARFCGSIGGAEPEFKADHDSRNIGRDLFGSPPPRPRKREYISDCEDELPLHKTRSVYSRGGGRQGLSMGARDGYDKRGYYREEMKEDMIRLDCELVAPKSRRLHETNSSCGNRSPTPSRYSSPISYSS